MYLGGYFIQIYISSELFRNYMSQTVTMTQGKTSLYNNIAKTLKIRLATCFFFRGDITNKKLMGSTNKTVGPHLAKVRQASQNHETASYRCGHQKQCVELFPWRRKKYEDAAGYQLEVWYTPSFCYFKGTIYPSSGGRMCFL